MEILKLIEYARQAKEKSYSPYSKFRVGAALLSNDGTVTQGANIENISYGLTICAERTAVFNAHLEGKTGFTAIAINSDSNEIISPCGACRQVMIEMCGNIDIIMSNDSGDMKVMKLAELLPLAFDEKQFYNKRDT
ncbi:MAG: cytidine deaminase [Ignavibacteriaceae bacterium]|nr:cytidine deaminase [Ignavibacteriaceae bacterium]